MIDQTRISRDLAEIIDMSVQLLAQAVSDANATVDGTSLPGGLAMVSLGPVADVVTWQRRIDVAERRWVAAGAAAGLTYEAGGVLVRPDDGSRPDWGVDDDDTTEPVLQVLRFWSDHYRQLLDQDWDHVRTIATEAKFLRHKDTLDWIVGHEPNVDHFATDINQARVHLESVLYAGRRPDRSRVVCDNPTCEHPRQLIRVYGRRYPAAWACRGCGDTVVAEQRACTDCHRPTGPGADGRCGAKRGSKTCEGTLVSTVRERHCLRPLCYTAIPTEPVWASDPADDRWKCTSCKKRYDDDDFTRAHAKQLLHESAEKYVVLADAIGTLVAQGRAERTIRKWLEPPIKHVDDQCTVCRRAWPPAEYAACPGDMLTKKPCGGELRPVKRGNPERVVDSFCVLTTHQVMVWWPDLWRLHLATPNKRAKTA